MAPPVKPQSQPQQHIICAAGAHSQDVDLGGPLCRGGDPSLLTGQRKPMGGDSLYSCACAIGSLEGQEVISLIHPVSLAHSVSKSPQAHRMLRLSHSGMH